MHNSPPRLDRRAGCPPLVGALGLLLLTGQLLGCDGGQTDQPLRKRTGTLVIEQCTLDAGQRSALMQDALRSVVSTAILLCPAIREGVVTPRDADAQQAMSSTISFLRSRVGRVELGITARDELGQDLSPTRLAALLHDPAQRALTVAGAASFASQADGLVVALPALPGDSEADVTAWVKALSAQLPGRKPSIFVPPSSTEPSDLPMGSAVNLAALGSSVRDIYSLTLDYSCCDGTPGPTTDVDWAASVVSLASRQSGASTVHLALPLYGVQFVDSRPQPLTFLAAAGLAGARHLQILRSDEGSLHYSFTDDKAARNEVWFDDAHTTARRLHALDSLVGPGVGVLYYSLGGEDPALWSTLQGLMK